MPRYSSEVKKFERKRRQRYFMVKVTIAFIIFCLIAAPLQFIFDWYSTWRDGEPTWLSGTLRTGLLFFYALTLCIEAFFRLERYPQHKEKDFRILILKLALFLPVLIFLFEYFVSSQYRSPENLSFSMQFLQVSAALSALLLSTIVHYIVTRQEMRSIR